MRLDMLLGVVLLLLDMGLDMLLTLDMVIQVCYCY